MPRILFYDYHLPYLIQDADKAVGGASVQLYSWLQGLTHFNHDVGVLTFKGAGELIEKQTKYKLIETYSLSGEIPILRWFYKIIPSLYKRTKQYNPDFIIKAGAGFQVGILTIIGKLLDIPFVYRVANDMDVDGRIKERVPLYSRILFNYGLSNSAGIICQNKYQFEKIKERFPRKPSIILYNPFYINGTLPKSKNLRERKYVAWVGIFSMKKNPSLLLKIAKIHENLEFRIAGKPATHLDEKSKIVFDELRKLKNIKFVGYLKRSEILNFLSKAYFLLNTSLYEGFSNAYLEAFASGTPVVSSSQNDPDGIISRNKLGLIINEHKEKNDFQELFDENNFNVMINNCRRYVLINHNPEKLASRLVEFLVTL